MQNGERRPTPPLFPSSFSILHSSFSIRGYCRLAFPTAVGAFAQIAEVVVFDAVAGALGEEVEDQVVEAERRRDVVARPGESLGRGGGQAGDVLGPVLARAEEERADDDALGAAPDAAGV